MTAGWPCFRGLVIKGAFDRHVVLDAYREQSQHGDHSTARLLADCLVRTAGVSDPTPLVMRASSLTQLGEFHLARQDLALALLRDPFDVFTNAAIMHAGDRTEALKALGRMVEAQWSSDAAGLLRSAEVFGLRAIIRCEGTSAGVMLSAVAPDPTTLTVECTTDAGTVRVDLPVEIRVGGTVDCYAGQTSVPWPAHCSAMSVVDPAGRCLVQPASVLKPPRVLEPSGRRLDMTDGSETRGLMIAIPVYGDFAATRDCLRSVLKNLPVGRRVRVVVVDDVTPEPEIRGLLNDMADRGEIELLRNGMNMGFAASVNRALGIRRANEDVLLLNADTILPPMAIDRLHDIVLANPGVGTVTPLSNNGEDTSMPRRFAANPMPSDAEIAEMNRRAWRANGPWTVAMPNGVGFCLMIAAPLLDQRPFLPTDFGRGYYEDVAYCLQARTFGFANVCATGVYIGHSGSRSFRDEKRALVRLNLAKLLKSFPDYTQEADTFVDTDPLAPAIARIEGLWLQEETFEMVVMGAEAPADLSRWLPVGTTLPVVIARERPSGRFVLAGLNQAAPQSFGAQEGVEEEVVRDMLGSAAKVLVVEPHRLALATRDVLTAANSSVTGIVCSVPNEDAADVSVVCRSLVATSGPLANAWRHWCPEVTVAASGASGASFAAAPLRDDAIYIVEGPDQHAVTALVKALVRLRGERTTKWRELVVIGPSPRPLPVPGIAWPGPIDQDERHNWLATAGPAPIILTSRDYGCGDCMVDTWQAMGCPIAIFDPTVQVAVESHGVLRFPVALGDDAAAALMLDFGLAREPQG
jgi:GT2 family glycosyltransferase